MTRCIRNTRLINTGLILAGAACIAASAAIPALAKQSYMLVGCQWAPSGSQSDALKAVAKAFEKQKPGLEVRIIWGMDEGKFLTSITGGVAPDVMVLGTKLIVPMGLRGIVAKVNTPAKAMGISKDDFWTPCWKQLAWGADQYGIPWLTDANFAFVWNKKLFAEAGLDPERPPTTTDELLGMNLKMTRMADNKKAKQIGFAPWWAYEDGNSIFTWALAFGGSFWDESALKFTIDSARNTKAFQWMQNYARSTPSPLVYQWDGNFNTGSLHPFVSGSVGMAMLSTFSTFDLRNAPRKLSIGITSIPRGPEGDADPTWVAGPALTIPTGTKAARKTLAWEFIKFAAASKAGTAVLGLGGPSVFPSYRKSGVYDDYRKDEITAPFIGIIERAKHYRPPLSKYLWEQLNPTLMPVLLGKKSPQQVLPEVDRLAQKEAQAFLDRVAKFAPKK